MSFTIHIIQKGVPHPYESHRRDGFGFESINWPFTSKDSIMVWEQNRIQEYIRYIRKHQLQSASIMLPNLEILRACPSLQYLKIHPAFDAPTEYDYTPLYERENLKHLHLINYSGDRMIKGMDCTKLQSLVSLSLTANKGNANYNRVQTLKTLRIGSFKGENQDLSDLFCSTELDTLCLLECKEQSLNGIERSPKMQYVQLSYNRQLCDITALKGVRDSLRALLINNCAKIEDFSVLGELENLERLEIVGSNVLPSLDFIKSMKNLKTLRLGVTVADGDLTPCLDLQWAQILQNKRYYNLRDQDLPKIKFVRGNEDIEEWRRLE